MLRRKQETPPLPDGQTDWDRLGRLTDAEIEFAVAADPDAAPILPDAQMRREYRPHRPRIKR